MRKHQQQLILALLKTIEQAQGDGQYADCQDGAISVGEFIESIEGEGTQTVALLEEYCELLFKANNGEVGVKPLRKHMIKIVNSVKSELKPNKVEIAFLSYNASMSDSIESIYLAAKSDPNCDAYWIPVPYYDRKSDGSFGAMHYEGADCYGEGIECTNWQDYDIGARRPDAIFTFNPYDGGNYVTSVHPNFYCERLRAQTDLLIYIPYFVTMDDVPEHFVTTAGCGYAHKVIVQSEKVRDTHIRVFKERYGNKFGKPQDKFVALGSPKFDRVISAKREDYGLPSEWANLIGRKKVIFYNTTVAAILAGNEQYLIKLRHVLDTFRNREDVVLWWRPHPLSMHTLESMRPGLLDEYHAIVADYKREGWGVYDETPDLHRAIAWCDAYYGGMSSLVPLIAAAGKPILIHNFAQLDLHKAHLRSCLVDGSRIYWGDTKLHALFTFDLSTGGQPTYLGSLLRADEQSNYKETCYFQCKANNGKIYFAPFNTSDIVVYDPKAGLFERIQCPELDDYSKNGKPAFVSCVPVDKYVFFFPFRFPAVMRLDTETHNISFYDDFIEPLKKMTQIADKPYFACGPLVCGDEMILVANCTNAIVFFNAQTCVSRVAELGEDSYRYHNICFDGSNYWITPINNAPILKLHSDKTTLEPIPFAEAELNTNRSAFTSGVIFGENLYMFPVFADKKVILNTIDKAISYECCASQCNDNDKTRATVKFNFAQCNDGKMIAYDLEQGELVVRTDENAEEMTFKLFYSDETLEAVANDAPKMGFETAGDGTSRITNENPLMNLNALSDSVRSRENSSWNQTGNHSPIGAKIYDYVKKEVLS